MQAIKLLLYIFHIFVDCSLRYLISLLYWFHFDFCEEPKNETDIVQNITWRNVLTLKELQKTDNEMFCISGVDVAVENTQGSAIDEIEYIYVL